MYTAPTLPLPIQIGDMPFSGKPAAFDYFEAMHARYKPCERIEEADAEALSALFQHHPAGAATIGRGIGRFEVSRARNGARRFRAVSYSGKPTDFSIGDCLKH